MATGGAFSHSTMHHSLGLRLGMVLLLLWAGAPQAQAEEIELLTTCGECSFYKYSNGTLFRTGDCSSTCSGSLYLHNKQIREIKDGTFSGLSSLQTLALPYNQISEIKDGTFSGLSSLQWLYLRYNQIREIKAGTFSGLSSLQYLSLYNNQIREIKDGTFSGLSSLRSLALYNNQIREIKAGTFSGLSSLQYLYLYNNRFGCVAGDFSIIEHLQPSWAEEVPGCPSNCSNSSYYIPDQHICVSCPEGGNFGGWVGWIGSQYLGDCCSSGSEWFQGTCLLSPLMPQAHENGNFSSCALDYTWDELIFTEFPKREADFKTGGLGSLMTRNQVETWLCERNHSCAFEAHDSFCFTYDEQAAEFYPWGLMSVLQIGYPFLR